MPPFTLALLASVWIARSAEAATVNVLENSATAFVANFSLAGAELFILPRPAAFVHFPTDVSTVEPSSITIARSTDVQPAGGVPMFTSRIWTNDPGGDSLFAVRGNPADPYATFSNQFSFGPLTLSGVYTNSLPVQYRDSTIHTFAGAVDWAYTNITDTGGPNGIFSGSLSFRFTPPNPVREVRNAEPASPTRPLANRSARGRVTADARPMINGFIITGPGPKTILLRAAGPGLAAFGLDASLATPTLTLFDNAGRNIATNTGWSSGGNGPAISAAATRVGAFPFATGSADSALLIRLEPGSYTARVEGGSGTEGIAMMEIYDAEPTPTDPPSTINLSARGQVGPGGDRLISGFVVDGTGSRQLLVRALGPALAAFGVGDFLAEPKIELFDSRGNLITESRGTWSQEQGAEIRQAGARAGAFALEEASRDAAMVVNLPAGTYTVQVSGLGSTAGTALVEVYDVP